MIALILKDIATIKKTLVLSLLISIAISLYGIYEGTFMMIPAVCAMLPLILTSISFGYDYKSNFEQYAFSMPFKKIDYVLSKLFFTFIYGMLGALAMFLALYFKNEMGKGQMILLSMAVFAVTVLISGIQLPFVFKFGADKGRLIMVVSYFIIFASASLLREYGQVIKGLLFELSKFSNLSLAILIVLVSMISLILSVSISVKIMENKEY
ncbi:ABC-2 transporter permease [Peptoniphilaceae bacterium SGI.131]